MNEETAVHAERKNRTVICTVLFADIVKFSEQRVSDQHTIKEHFNKVVGEAAASIAPNDRMVLDTGDGLAMCLFGDPEEGMFLALALRDGFGSIKPSGVPEYTVRLGLNLGPIKVVTDLNGQYNAIGDGINVAQRVMNFAQPGQVLCARSYFEVVSRLSDDFSKLFEYCGVRHDKHVREHDVYQVRTPASTGSAGYDVPVENLASVAPEVRVTLSDEVKEKLAALLAKYEGPMAKIMVRKACEKESTPQGVVQRIADQMHDANEAKEFLQAARSVIQ